jgi:hypothetical protein
LSSTWTGTGKSSDQGGTPARCIVLQAFNVGSLHLAWAV